MKTNSNLRIAKVLVRMARMLVAFNRSQLEVELSRKRSDLNEASMKEYLDCLEEMDAKEQKAALYWINKKRLILPEDLSKFNEAMNLIDKQHLDFQDFDSPEEVVNRDDKSTRRIKSQSGGFNPAAETAFSNPYDAGLGITIYDVKDDFEGMYAVRHAVDATLGFDKNPWCLISRDGAADNPEEELDTAFSYWTEYDAYPKRIAFQHGRPIAFCANDNPEVIWWDKNDSPSRFLPGGKDNPDFLAKYDLLPQLKELVEDGGRESVERLLSLLENDESGRVMLALTDYKRLPEEVVEYVYENGSNTAFGNMLETCENIPQEFLMKWAAKSSDDCKDIVFHSVAMDGNTFAHILGTVESESAFELAISSRFDVLAKPDVYAAAAVNPNERNRLRLAWRISEEGDFEKCAEAVEILSNDKSKAVREAIARE